MESPEESKNKNEPTTEIEQTLAPPKPLARKKSTSRKKLANINSKEETKLILDNLTEQIPVEVMNEMANKINAVLLNHEPSKSDTSALKKTTEANNTLISNGSAGKSSSEIKTSPSSTSKKAREVKISSSSTEKKANKSNSALTSAEKETTDVNNPAVNLTEKRGKVEGSASVTLAEKKGNEAIITPISKGKKKNKANLEKSQDKSSNDKENVSLPQETQKLMQLADTLEDKLDNFYHQCLASDSDGKNNGKGKCEAKRKGQQNEEPKQIFPKKNQHQGEQTTGTAPANKCSEPSSTDVVKKQSIQKTQSKTCNPRPKSVQVKTRNLLEDLNKAKLIPSKQNQEQSKLSSKLVEECNKPKVVPSKQNSSKLRLQTVASRPKTTPSSTKPQTAKAKPVVKKSTHVNFENENTPCNATATVKNTIDKASQASLTRLAVQNEHVNPTSSCANPTASSDVKSTSSRPDTLDYFNKIISKSSHTQKTVKFGMNERLFSSLPVSTRESRNRFNPREPSPSATHIPPMIVSAHELKCGTFDPKTKEPACQPATAVPSKKAKSNKPKAVKKVNAVDESIENGKDTACDNSEKISDKADDQAVRKLWKKGKSETDGLKSAKPSCKSMTDANSTLTTSPSEKAYIDNVVRTAVKLAKRNMKGTSKKSKRKGKNMCETDTNNSGKGTVPTVVSSTLAQVGSGIGANQTQPKKAKNKLKKSATTDPSLALIESPSK